MHFRNPILASLLRIASDAAQEVMAVYARPFHVDFKTPEDPITEADRRANLLITRRLAAEYPAIPVVAEETPPRLWGNRQQAERIFFVDPVDGTREFVERNDQFTIMIGLVEGVHPSVGVVWAPALNQVWAASREDGALRFKVETEVSSSDLISTLNDARQVHVSQTQNLSKARFMLSPRFDLQKAGKLAQQLLPEQRILIGGAGLKAVGVADGQADVYATPHHQGSRWDCCAPEAIVRAAGGKYTDAGGRALDYRSDNVKNDRGIIATNGLLHEACIEVMKPLLPQSHRD